MIRADQIPPEVVEAAARAIGNARLMGRTAEETARAAIAAALNAWPMVTTTSWFENSTRKAVLNLPLPLETRDE